MPLQPTRHLSTGLRHTPALVAKEKVKYTDLKKMEQSLLDRINAKIIVHKDSLKDGQQIAGLRFTAPSKKWVSANGFNTGKDELDVLSATARNNRMDEALGFLSDLKRLNAISSYLSALSTEYGRTLRQTDSHVGLTQHITATGRFGGRNPNMQNMPEEVRSQ